MLDKSFPKSVRTERTRLGELAKTVFTYHTELIGYKLTVNFRVDVGLLEWDNHHKQSLNCGLNFVDPRYSVDDIRQAIAKEQIDLRYIIRNGTSLGWGQD